MNQNKNSSSLILVHHGIPGQKWGVRRYQNEDGTLTPEGRRRQGYDNSLKPQKALGARTTYGGSQTNYRNNRNGSNAEAGTAVRKSRPSRKKESSKGGLFETIGSSLGFDKKKEYLDAKQEQYTHDLRTNPYLDDYGEMAQDHIDETNEKYAEIGWDKLTDEDAADLEFFTKLRDNKQKEYKALESKTHALYNEYKDTPIGKVETAFNETVESGKSWIDQAASDVGDFFGNLFGKK